VPTQALIADAHPAFPKVLDDRVEGIADIAVVAA
jgi:hypothetical protein